MISDTGISQQIEKCSERLSKLCLNLCRNYHDAADLFQDTCLRAVKYYKSFDRDSDFEKWIFKICVNTHRSGLRKLYRIRQVTFSTVQEHDSFFLTLPRTEDPSVREEYLELIKAVNRLPEKYRTVLVLRYFNDLSEKDVSEMLSIPAGTVKSRLNKAKELIRKEIDGEK